MFTHICFRGWRWLSLGSTEALLIQWHCQSGQWLRLNAIILNLQCEVYQASISVWGVLVGQLEQDKPFTCSCPDRFSDMRLFFPLLYIPHCSECHSHYRLVILIRKCSTICHQEGTTPIWTSSKRIRQVKGHNAYWPSWTIQQLSVHYRTVNNTWL